MKSAIQKILIGTVFISCVAAYADDVTEAISEGTAHYNKGNLSDAAAQLDYAATLIRQQKASHILAVFPAPLPKWQAQDAEGDTASAGMLGGGITANKTYTQGKEKWISIELVMDSPMMQSMLPMFSNPSMITMSGAKLIKVQGHKAMLRNEDGNIELILIVNNNAMFTLRGGYGATVKEVKAYAEALLLEKLN